MDSRMRQGGPPAASHPRSGADAVAWRRRVAVGASSPPCVADSRGPSRDVVRRLAQTTRMRARDRVGAELLNSYSLPRNSDSLDSDSLDSDSLDSDSLDSDSLDSDSLDSDCPRVEPKSRVGLTRSCGGPAGTTAIQLARGLAPSAAVFTTAGSDDRVCPPPLPSLRARTSLAATPRVKDEARVMH